MRRSLRLLGGFWQGLLGLASLLAVGASAAQTVGLPLTFPDAVHQGVPSTVTVQARIQAAGLIPGSVNVQQVDAGSRGTVLGLLNDSGTDGDALAGDGVYSGRIVVNEAAEGAVRLRVSFAMRGSLKRTLSPVSTLAVLPADAPLSSALGDLDSITTDPVSGARFVGDLIHVCFSPGVSFSRVKALALQVSAVPVGSSADIGNCFQLQLPAVDAAAVVAAIATLGALPEVVYAEPDYEVEALADSCSVPFICTDVLNYDQVLHMPIAHGFANGEGLGVLVAVLDSGLAPLYHGSPGFPGQILGTDFVRPGGGPVIDDVNGHGTRVALVAQAAAPKSRLLITRVLNNAGKGNNGRYAKGLDEASRYGAKVVNLSFGSIWQTRRILDKLNRLQSAGALIVAAAGNSGDSVRMYPAAHVGAIAVGNTDPGDKRWDGGLGNFMPSNFGFWVNISAPGVGIGGAPDATATSFSAPWVSGTLAMIRSKFPAMTAAEAKDQLYRTAMPIPATPNADTCPNQPCNQDLGVGRVDPLAALGAIRVTRSTAVGAAGAATPRTLEVGLTDAGGVVRYASSFQLVGQSFACQVITVRNPPCAMDVPFDFADLPPGSYSLRLSFRTAGTSFFGEVRLMAPQSSFTAVTFGSGGTVDVNDATKATFSLFGGTAPTVIFRVTKL